MTQLAQQAAFISLALLTLIPALMVVQARSIVHAGFWLLPSFMGVAGLYAALEAHFFFVTQLLIYAGAILVLVLFALMITRNAMDPEAKQNNRLQPVAALVCGLFAITAAYVLSKYGWPVTDKSPADAAGQAKSLGAALIGDYAVPFEVSSLLLLAALVGAVVLAKSDRGPAAEPPPLGDLAAEAQAGE